MRLTDLLLEIVDPDRDGSLRPSRDQVVTFSLYLACAALYLGIGLANVDFLLSFWVGVVYLLVTAWLIPAGVRRLL